MYELRITRIFAFLASAAFSSLLTPLTCFSPALAFADVGFRGETVYIEVKIDWDGGSDSIRDRFLFSLTTGREDPAPLPFSSTALSRSDLDRALREAPVLTDSDVDLQKELKQMLYASFMSRTVILEYSEGLLLLVKRAMPSPNDLATPDQIRRKVGARKTLP